MLLEKNQKMQSVNIEEPQNSGDGEALVAEEIEDETIDVELSPSDLPKEIIEGDGIRTEKIEQEEGKKISRRERRKSLGKEMETSQEDAIKDFGGWQDLMSSSIIKIFNFPKNHRKVLRIFLMKTWLLSLDQIWIEII